MTATTTPGTTTVRVTIDTRNRLNDLLATDYKGMTIDQLVQHLLDEEWKRACLADWDRFRTEDPQGWQEYLREADAGTAEWGRYLNETEGPYRSDDPDFIAAGGLPLTTGKDAA